MTTSLYAEQEADFRFKGDYVLVDGTLESTGAFTPSGGIVTPTLAGATTISSPAVTVTKSLTINTKMTTDSGLKFSCAPSGTYGAGAVWTSAAPAFTTGQSYIVVTAGSTAWRIPVFDNA
jgi:hypothetical protein